MRIIYLILVTLLSIQRLFSFEQDMLNLKVPSNLDQTDMVFSVFHRFYGEITEEPFNTFFGLDAGANVGIGLRYAVFPKLELNTSYTRYQKEYVIGASYAHFFHQFFLRSQLDVQFFTYEMTGIEERQRNFFYNLAVQSEPLFRKITPTLNVGYDGYNESFGFGAGIDIGFDLDIRLIERVSVIGEYYPIIGRDDVIHGAENFFVTGLKIETYGHHFMLLVGNSSQIGTRRLILGTNTNDLFLGFNVNRIIDL